ASSRASIIVQDKLSASQCQPVLQHGYQCTLCCHIFPTPRSVMTQIQHSSREGYSCKGFYCRSKALGEQELKAREAAAPTV
ncbi:SPT46 protein, partial [Ifrita kowaldi]|nr:SPT46 protein [Ifrita kowaldi]